MYIITNEYWRVSSVAHGQVAATLGYFQLPIICFCGYLAFCCVNKVDVFRTEGELLPGVLASPFTIMVSGLSEMLNKECNIYFREFFNTNSFYNNLGPAVSRACCLPLITASDLLHVAGHVGLMTSSGP